MTSKELPDERSIAHLPTDAALVGTDGREQEHLHSRIRDAVYIIDDSEIIDVQTLEGRGLGAYVQFVEKRRGWAQLRYAYNGLADLLSAEEAM